MVNNNTYEDRYTAQSASSGQRSGLTMLLVGGGIGAVLALLFAPKSGREIRTDIANVSRKGYDLTLDKAEALKAQSAEKLQLVKEKAGAAYEFAAAKIASGGEALSDAAATTSSAIAEGLDEVHNDSSVRTSHASIDRNTSNLL